jgi:AraC family transcriptional regulator, regulatory protein of adaptative response / DNA-3-methyladenine glycosylase II
MRSSHATLYARLLARDPSYDGSFFTGVLTTGIYCLPSCGARKPRRENVRFFPTCEAARAAGLRACKKCHPDDYARGADPVLETIEAVVAELRAAPARFADAGALVRRTGYGATRAFELFRQHFHATPADLIAAARLDTARGMLLAGDTPLAELAFASGYESLSAFNDAFRIRTGLTPGATRALARSGRHAEAADFTLALPAGYALDRFLASVGRDPGSISERLEGVVFHAAAHIGGIPTRLCMEFSAADAVRVTLPAEFPAVLRPSAAARVAALLGLSQDAAGFTRLAQKLGLSRLVAGRETLRLVGSLDPWDSLVWAILGQQINLPFAFRLRRVLTELAGTPVGNGLSAPPAPAAVAALAPEALLACQFSRQKADYLIAVARLVADGSLDLQALAGGSATRAERTLRAVRGLGPWTVNYVMMRGLGFADCVPYGDTGVTSGLQKLLALETRPDAEATRRLMLPFAPYRSLATAHLWQL